MLIQRPPLPKMAHRPRPYQKIKTHDTFPLNIAFCILEGGCNLIWEGDITGRLSGATFPIRAGQPASHHCPPHATTNVQ